MATATTAACCAGGKVSKTAVAAAVVQHPAPVQIGEHGDVRMPAPKALFIERQKAQPFRLAPSQAPGHVPAHDVVGGGPTDPEQGAGLLDTGAGQQHVHGQALEQEREAPMRRGPRHVAGFGPVFGAVGPRDAGGHLGFKLHRVPMPPGPRGGGVVDGAGPAADGALGGDIPLPSQFDVHLFGVHFQFHGLDDPRAADPQPEGVVLLQFVIHMRAPSLP